MLRRACTCVLFAAAALAVVGCRTVSELPQSMLVQSGTVIIVTNENKVSGKRTCEVADGKKMIIAYDIDGEYPNEVAWKRYGDMSGTVNFKLLKDENKEYFESFDKPIPDGKREKKSGKLKKTPPAGHVVGYEIKWKNVPCDPEICIRVQGQGCNGFLEDLD